MLFKNKQFLIYFKSAQLLAQIQDQRLDSSWLAVVAP